VRRPARSYSTHQRQSYSYLNLAKSIVMPTFKKMTLALASLAPTVLASSAPSKMTVGVIGGMIYNASTTINSMHANNHTDFGWTGWRPAPLSFCNDVMPKLIAKNITIPREVQNDCDPGDRTYVANATALQGKFSLLPNNMRVCFTNTKQPTPPPTSAKSARRRAAAPSSPSATTSTTAASTSPPAASSASRKPG
jgi:hypothetical protein